MSTLSQLEVRILQALPQLNLRPTLDRAAEVGRLLTDARPQLPHGEWIPWLKRVGLSRRTAHDYLAVYTHLGNVRPAAHMTIKGFLEHVRRVRHLERVAERDRVRAASATSRGRLPAGCELVNADCRRYEWPPVDGVCTDPPWASMASYEWLGTWAVEHVRPGGPILVQCGSAHLAAVLNILSQAGLNYIWTLAMWFSQSTMARPVGHFRPTWRPVVLFTVGERLVRPEAISLTDGYTVASGETKPYHAWQQPLAPLAHWLGRLMTPGQTVADPFAGSGTTAVACQECGLGFIGTEIDRTSYRVARGRLATLQRADRPVPKTAQRDY